MLIARLRPLWEKGQLNNSSGVEKIELINRDGEKVSCEFAIPVDGLQQYLELRIEQGIQNFFVALKNAFANKLPSEVHVLLAGNSSRSNLVSAFLGLIPPAGSEGEEVEHPLFIRIRAYLDKLFGDVCPGITVHPPLPMDEADPYLPTAKTGMALGLLRLCPGGAVDVISHVRHTSGDEAPFAHYVGRVRHDAFQPVLRPGASYNEWYELGRAGDRVFNLFYSQAPRASTGDMKEGEAGLFKKRLDLAGDTQGKRIFARALSPNCVEYCTGGSLEEVKMSQSLDNLKRIELR